MNLGQTIKRQARGRRGLKALSLLELLICLSVILVLTAYLVYRVGKSTRDSIRAGLEGHLSGLEQVRLMLTQLEDNGQVPGYARRASALAALPDGNVTVLAKDTPLYFTEGSKWAATDPEAWFARYLTGLDTEPGQSRLFHALRMGLNRLDWPDDASPAGWQGIPLKRAAGTAFNQPLVLSYSAAEGWKVKNR